MSKQLLVCPLLTAVVISSFHNYTHVLLCC